MLLWMFYSRYLTTFCVAMEAIEGGIITELAFLVHGLQQLRPDKQNGKREEAINKR